MKAPERLYLQVCGDCQDNECDNCKFEDLEDNVTWCKDKIFKKDIEYTRTDAFIEKACSFLFNTIYDKINSNSIREELMEDSYASNVIEDFRKYMEE